MKSLLFVFLCVLVVDYSMCLQKKDVKLPPEAATALFLAVQQCMAGPNGDVPFEDLLKVSEGGYNENKKFKDFIYCCYKNAGYLNPDGTMNTKKSAILFKDNPVVLDGINRCSQETGKTNKESVFNYFKCFQEKVPVRFVL